METEKFELMLDEAQANAALEKGMLYADTFVNKNYLINLDRYPLVELDSAEKSDEYIRLYQIERIVYDVDENANDKLISVYSAFFNIQAAGLLVIKSTRNALGFYIGVRSVDNTSTAEAILEKSFKGNFAGSQIQAIPQEEVQKVLGSINKSGRFGTRQNVSSVSIVPSTRDEDKERFVQGIEKFIDTMKGSEYTAVFIAEPLDKEILEQRKRGLQKIYSGLSPFASTQLSYGENYSKAVSKGMSENFSKTLNDSLTDTTSHFNSRSTSRSHGTSFGFLGIGFNNSTSTGYSSGSSWASAVTRGTSETKGETVTETDTDTTGDSRTITVTSENKSVKYILEKIDQHLARIKNCEAFGLWDIACYFVSENVQTSVVAASTYKAWNIVRINGYYHHVDVTWDNQYSDSSAVSNYGYMNLSDDEIAKDHTWNRKHYPECPSSPYNYFRVNNALIDSKAQLESMLYNSFQMEEEFIMFRVVRGSILEREINGCLTDSIQRAANRCKHISVSTFRYGGVPEQLTFFVQPDYCYR